MRWKSNYWQTLALFAQSFTANNLKSCKLNQLARGDSKTADRRIIERKVSIAEIEINNEKTRSIIVYGKSENTQVLGATTLEEFGLQVDPVTIELKP